MTPLAVPDPAGRRRRRARRRDAGADLVRAPRNKDTGDHYVAGRRIGGFGNGLALAGDQISAASFLGITGAIALTGFNGFWLAVGLPIAYVLVLLLVAEPLRNLGKFTLADVIATRFESLGLRGSIAAATIIMTVIYMTVQFIGAGLIAGALLDVNFTVAVLLLGVLMTIYTVLGGMVAATYIQIFKTACWRSWCSPCSSRSSAARAGTRSARCSTPPTSSGPRSSSPTART